MGFYGQQKKPLNRSRYRSSNSRRLIAIASAVQKWISVHFNIWSWRSWSMNDMGFVRMYFANRQLLPKEQDRPILFSATMPTKNRKFCMNSQQTCRISIALANTAEGWPIHVFQSMILKRRTCQKIFFPKKNTRQLNNFFASTKKR